MVQNIRLIRLRANIIVVLNNEIAAWQRMQSRRIGGLSIAGLKVVGNLGDVEV